MIGTVVRLDADEARWDPETARPRVVRVDVRVEGPNWVWEGKVPAECAPRCGEQVDVPELAERTGRWKP